MNWKEHRDKWKNCTACPLHENRLKVVLARGTIPCEVLFVGEAPGSSEDVDGRPFVGPAGHLLDMILGDVFERLERTPTYAMTNLVACIPLGEDGHNISEPSKACIEACSDRLEEFIEMAEPSVIVYLGKLAYKHGTYEGIEVIHPAAILRADVSQKSLMIKRTILAITNALS